MVDRRFGLDQDGGRVLSSRMVEISRALVDLDPSSWQDGNGTSRTSIVLPAALLDDLREAAGNGAVRDALEVVIPNGAGLGTTDSVSGIVRAATAAVLSEVREELLAMAYAASAEGADRADGDLLTDESLAHA